MVGVNIKEMKEMIQLMNENNLTEIELEKEGLKIRLKKGSSGYEQSIVHHQVPAATMPRVAETEHKDSPKAPATAKAIIKSPMVGTYYSSPAPDSPPFIQVGSQVEIGQVICIIEAMKLMNEIKAEVRGKIAEILVSNGDPVEFGQSLFRIE